MKKNYTAPNAEKIEFCYRDQVVAASADQCKKVYVNTTYSGGVECQQYETQIEYTKDL